ncbi:MAG TPA: GyrI-like domain-containing protein [Bacteroidales bacterium]|nr:GyrI-like domain-containing protein [Bacteroidales bacterium]
MKTFTCKSIVAIAVFAAFQGVAFSQEKFEIKEIGAQKTVIITMTAPSSQISAKMGEAYGKLFGYLGQKGVQPSGAPFAVYTQFDPNANTTFEAGVPVSSKMEGIGDVVYKEYPAMKVLSTLYKGAYTEMTKVYESMEKYMKDKGLQSTMAVWEIYLTDPAQVKKPEDNQTLIYFPIK